MDLRQGIVVGVHPEDHSVDLVMLDDGSRLTGVQVATPNGSAKSGTFNMPPVPDRGDKKWDITQKKEGEQTALVGFMRGNPVVVGYLFPQKSEMTFADGKRMVFRHPSDVTFSIEESGATHFRHPSGLSISIGTPSNAKDGENEGKNADGNFAVKNNKGETTNIEIKMPGFSLKADKSGIKIKAQKVTLDAKKVVTGGDLHVGGSIIPNSKEAM